MKDEDIPAWLSDRERIAWVDRYDGDDLDREILRSLAETRAALAETEWQGNSSRVGMDEFDEWCCQQCGAIGPMRHDAPKPTHKPDCIFAAMPRPS